MEEKRGAHRVLEGKPDGGGHLEDPGIQAMGLVNSTRFND